MKKLLLLVPVLVLAVAIPAVASASGHLNIVFGIDTTPDGSIVAADATQGIVELRKGGHELIADLPGVSDIAVIGNGSFFAITAEGDSKVYSVSKGKVSELADLAAFEEANDPFGGEVESNPFEVQTLNGGHALVADAAANDLLMIDRQGNVELVAVFPTELVDTTAIKALAGCDLGPPPPPDFAFVCGLPGAFPAEPVPTSVAVGPDGWYYVGELKGFPSVTGESRIWKIAPGARNVECGVSPDCVLVADGGFTAIVDMQFGPDGTLYVVELDEAGWLAAELGLGAGGTVNTCDVSAWTCTERATDLPLPTAVGIDKHGNEYVTILSLIPGAADVIPLP